MTNIQTQEQAFAKYLTEMSQKKSVAPNNYVDSNTFEIRCVINESSAIWEIDAPQNMSEEFKKTVAKALTYISLNNGPKKLEYMILGAFKDALDAERISKNMCIDITNAWGDVYSEQIAKPAVSARQVGRFTYDVANNVNGDNHAN